MVPEAKALGNARDMPTGTTMDGLKNQQGVHTS